MNKLLLLLLTFITATAFSQSVVVLPQDGSYSQAVAPQGAFRYQRQFYLVTPSEMAKSGFANGMTINSIGFTNGVGQGDTSKGAFKVYLQNSANTVSRTDTGWTTVSSTTNSYHLAGLTSGSFEWQIQSVCPGTSVDTASASFSTTNLTGCNQPTNFISDNITTTSATLHWTSPASVVTNFIVQYTRIDSVNWITDTVLGTSKTITGLLPGKNYSWTVKTICAGGSSDAVTAAFTTEVNPAGCNLPSSLTTGAITNTTAVISWTAASGAAYYGIQYRRSGTSSYANTIAVTTSATLSGLKAGTTYEWRVRTICGAGNGAYVSGTPFTTTGTIACYAPPGLSSDSLTDSSAVLTWISTGATSYTIRYRQKDYISWTNAITPMTLVHNDSITITPATGSYDIPFTGGSSFTYTGGSVYVAFEFMDTTGSSPAANTALSTVKNTVIKGVAGQDSLRFILSLGANDDSALPSILTATNLRPETRFGSPGMADSVEVSNVYAMGNVATGFGTPTSITALVKNLSSSSQTYTVNLSVKDQASNAVRTTGSQSATVAGNSSQVVTFASWSPSLIEKDSIIVSVAAQTGENYTLNNSSYYLQKVNASIMAYDDGGTALAGAGFDSTSGLVLARYSMNGCGRVNAAQVYLRQSAKNHSLRAVVLNASGAVVDTSDYFTPDSSQVNNYHSFYFLHTPFFSGADYYVGLAQAADTVNPYLPVGVQWEGTDIRGSAYYRANLDGTGLTDHPSPGRLMIRAEVIPGTPTVAITGKLSLCPSDTNTLKAVSVSTRFANSLIAYSSQASGVAFSALQALGTPNVYPSYAASTDGWASVTGDGQREYLTLGFANAAPVNFIDIYETYNPGAVDTVYVKNPVSNNYDVVYTGTAATAPASARINHITFPLTSYNVSEVRIAINSPAVSGYNAIDAVSAGSIDDSAYLPSVSYAWSTAETTQSIYVTSAATYTVTATNVNTCTASVSAVVYTPAIVTPTISADRPTTFCPGDTAVKLTSSQLTGNLWSTGATTRTITVSTSGSYTVSYNDGTGCGITTSAPTVVTVNPLPVVTVTGNPAFCPASSTTLNAGSGYTGYNWSTGATTQTISVSTAGSFSITVTDSLGCKGKKTVVTSVSALPNPNITGNSFFCPGSAINLDAGAGFTTYSWSTGATTQTIPVNNAATYTVTVTNGNGCTKSTSAGTHLYTPPTPFTSGNPSFCPGGSTIITASTGYAGYSWSTGVTNQSVTITTGATFTVTVTDGNGCTGSATRVTSLFTPPSPVISGNLSFCNGGTTVIDAGIGYPVYNWSTGANSHAITVNSVGTYTVTVTDNNGCSGSANATTTLSATGPGTPGAITGQVSGLCNAPTKTYSIASVSNATFYQWTVPAGDSILSGQGTISVNVLFNNFSAGIITVVALNSCGQSPPQSLSITGAPAIPVSISGNTTGACKKTGEVYSASSIGATGYTWTVPIGATIVSGQGTGTVTVNYGTGFTSSGNVCVTATNACGNQGSKCIAIAALPLMPASITGPAAVCKKAQNVAYSTPVVYGAATYTWDVPPSAKVATGQGTNAITVNFGNVAGNVTVKTNNTCGSSSLKSLAVVFNCREAGDVLDGLTFNAYPNPTTGKITVAFETSENGKYILKVYDMIGNLVADESFYAEEGTNNHELDLSSAAKGMYFLKLEKENGVKGRMRIVVE